MADSDNSTAETKKEPAKKAPPAKSGQAAAGAKSDQVKKERVKKERSSTFRVLTVRRLIWLAVLLVLAWFSWPLWGPLTPGWMQTVMAPVMEAGRANPLTRDLAALTERVTTLEAGVTELRAGLATRSLSSATAAHAEKLKQLEAGLESVQDGLKNQPPATIGPEMRARIETLEQKVEQLAVAAAATVAQLPDMDVRLGAVETRLNGLERRPPSSTTTPAPDQGTAFRLQALEAENELLSKMVAALQQRLTALERERPAAVVTSADNTGVLMLAVATLKDAAVSGAPWEDHWKTVSSLAGDDADLRSALAALQPFAARPAPSLETLRREFPAAADAAAKAVNTPAGDGWIDRTVARISALVTIRRTGAEGSAAGGPKGALARAELALGKGDLPSAIKALGALEGKAADAIRPWLDHARSRAAQDRAVERLQSAALVLSGEKSGG